MFSIVSRSQTRTGVSSMRKIYYQRLRELMAKHLLDKKDVSKIIKKSYRQTLKILSNEVSKASGKPLIFDIKEASLLVEYFRSLGENDLTLDELFFDDALSIASTDDSDKVSNF